MDVEVKFVSKKSDLLVVQMETGSVDDDNGVFSNYFNLPQPYDQYQCRLVVYFDSTTEYLLYYVQSKTQAEPLPDYFFYRLQLCNNQKVVHTAEPHYYIHEDDTIGYGQTIDAPVEQPSSLIVVEDGRWSATVRLTIANGEALQRCTCVHVPEADVARLLCESTKTLAKLRYENAVLRRKLEMVQPTIDGDDDLLTIVIGERKVNVNKELVCDKSSVIKEMVANSPRSTIRIDDIEYDVMKLLIEGLESDEFEITSAMMAMKLKDASERYGIETAVAKAREYILQNV